VFYRYSVAVRDEMAQASRLAGAREAALVARNSMLRYQVRPHFLFNALNALLALALDARWAEAKRMAEALSAFVDTSFAAEDRDFIPIGEQLGALQTYLSIEGVRFGDRLRFRLDLAPDLPNAQAPALILQPLVENAMKYAVATTAEPVEVEIRVRRAGEALLLQVRDSGGDSGAPTVPGLGISLRNVRERLAGHYGEKASLTCERLTPQGFLAEIHLPLEFACTSFAE
jgi:LytS/YehU family sensor histidine kinase